MAEEGGPGEASPRTAGMDGMCGAADTDRAGPRRADRGGSRLSRALETMSAWWTLVHSGHLVALRGYARVAGVACCGGPRGVAASLRRGRRRQRSTRTDRSRPGTRMVWWRCGRPWGSIAGIKFRGGWGGFGLGPQGGEGAGGGHLDGEGGAGPAGVLRSDVALPRILGKRRGIVFLVPRIFPPPTRDCLWRRSQSEALFHSFPKLGWRCYF
jgi:hypothetical protein